MYEDKSTAGFFINQTFTLIMGNQKKVFKGDLFAKMSKKCQSLLENGITESTIKRKVDKDTFNTFINACQLQPFKVNANNAYDLLYLAQDWEIASLEKFANDFINQKDINPPPPKDYILILQEKTKSNTLDIDDVRCVSAKINEAMVDDRFIGLPPEVIFQTILEANPYDIDPEILLKFTMNLFDKKPSTGIPLTVLANFEGMTPEQRSKIFKSRKMHEENLNFFISWAISALRNNAAENTRALLNRCNFQIAKNGEDIKQSRKTDKTKYHDEHDPGLDNLVQTISDQEKEINNLVDEIEKDAADESRDEEERQSILKANREAIQAIEEDGNKCGIHVAGTTAQVRGVVKDHIGKLREELDGEIKAVADDNDAKCSTILENLDAQVQTQADIIAKLLERTQRLTKDIDRTNAEIHKGKATLTAKVVRDKLRCDEFIRDTDKRFEIFGQSSQKWDLTSKEVEKAEKFIEQFEIDIAKYCPIRGNANYSPPTSPKLLTKKKEDEKKDEQQKKKDNGSEQTNGEEEEDSDFELEPEEEETGSSGLRAPLSPPQSP